jgi:hypothetical protein
MQAVVKTYTSHDHQRRVQIVRRDDGLFSFIEEHRADDWEGNACWTPMVSRGRSLPICDSEATAEREARSRISWLTDQPGLHYSPS